MNLQKSFIIISSVCCLLTKVYYILIILILILIICSVRRGEYNKEQKRNKIAKYIKKRQHNKKYHSNGGKYIINRKFNTNFVY